VPGAVEPAFGFVLIVIDSLSESRARASDGCDGVFWVSA